MIDTAEPLKKVDSRMVVQLSVEELRTVIWEAVQAKGAAQKDDRLLIVEQVAEILNTTEEWVYHNAKKLPFVRKIGGMLRFSAYGLQRYIESKKFTTAKGDIFD